MSLKSNMVEYQKVHVLRSDQNESMKLNITYLTG